jgi:pimeloyl-ACP methyl ester carboxylesterase
MNSDIGIVLIHGAGLGSWIWSDTVKYLQTESLAVNFPDRDRYAVNSSCSFDNYCEHLSEQISVWDKGRVILAAHSIGGVLALKLADQLGDRVAGFIGIGSAISKNGGSFLSTLTLTKRLLLPVILRIAGTKPPNSAIIGSLCNDLSDEQAETVAEKFVAESIQLYFGKCNAPVPDTQKLYIRCSKDLEFPQSLQDKMIKNLNTRQISTLESGHLPMLSCPKELAEILDRFAVDLI